MRESGNHTRAKTGLRLGSEGTKKQKKQAPRLVRVARRPGSPPPELLEYEGTGVEPSLKWHEGAKASTPVPPATGVNR